MHGPLPPIPGTPRSKTVGQGNRKQNANRVTLTTGTPVFDGNGGLQSFRVTDGTIDIKGGLYAGNVDRVDLLSRAITVNAGLWANELNIVTGANDIGYNNSSISPIAAAGAGTQPQVAVDVGDLGGMYANKIRLIGTENGVGVNIKGRLSTTGDLTIDNAGKVTLVGDTYAGGNIQVTAKDSVTNSGVLYAQGNVAIDTQGTLQNIKAIAAGQNTNVTTQSINSTGTMSAGVTREGNLGTTGDLTVNSAGKVIFTNDVLAAGNIQVTAQDSVMNNGILYAQGNVTVDTKGTLQNAKAITAGQNTKLTVQTLDSTGTIYAGASKEGTLGTTGDLTIKSTGKVTFANDVLAAGNIQITAQDSVTNNGMLYAQGNIAVDTQGALQNANMISAGQNMSLTAQSIDSTGAMYAGVTKEGTLGTTGDLIINSKGKATFANDVLAAGNLQVTAQDSVTNSGILYAQGNVTIDTQGALQNAKTIMAGQHTKLTAQSIDSNGSIYAGEAQDGTLGASGDLIINSAGKVSISGDALAAGNIQVTAQDSVTNNGIVYAQGNVNINTQGMLENVKTIAAGHNTNLTVQNIISTGTMGVGADKNGYIIGSSGDLTITGTGKATLSGATGAAGNVTIEAADVDLSFGQINAGNAATITATQKDVRNDYGSIQAANGLKVMAANGHISNNGGRMLNTGASKFTLLSTGNTVYNDGGVIASDGAVYIQGKNVENRGQILSKGATAIFASVYNSGLINSDSTLLISPKTADVINDGGRMISTDWLLINGNVPIRNINGGLIVSAKEISLWGPGLTWGPGLGAPRILFNGYDQLYNASIPVIDYWSGTVYNYHFYLDAGSLVPGYTGAFSSALNSLLYVVEGDPRSAARELV